MKKATENAFQSQFGFSSPGFFVDASGNLVVNTLTVTDGEGNLSESVVNYTVTESEDGNYLFSGVTGDNPSIEIIKGQPYVFKLELTTLDFNFKRENLTDPYELGLVHSDGSRNAQANGKSTGLLQITVPAGYSENIIYYVDQSGSPSGSIILLNPAGVFTTVSIESTANSSSSTTGALTVAGGVGIEKDLFIGGELSLGGLGIPRLSSANNLELNATDRIVLQVENTNIGYVDGSGLSIVINNSSMVNSTIDDTVIGQTTPSTATFTNASIQDTPVNNTDATNKSYVDTTATALAIALGS